MSPEPQKQTLSQDKVDDYAISGESLLGLMKAVLAKGADFRFQATGISMAPFIKNCDEIVIVPTSREKPALGKVVAFVRPSTGNLVVHRIIAKEGNVFRIQGDNAMGRDTDLVGAEAILGCVVSIDRDGQRVFLGLGPERYLVAFLSRIGLLEGLLARLRAIKNFLNK